MTGERLLDALMALDDGVQRAFRRRGNSAVEFAFAVGSAAYCCASSLAVLVVLVAWDSWHRTEGES